MNQCSMLVILFLILLRTGVSVEKKDSIIKGKAEDGPIICVVGGGLTGLVVSHNIQKAGFQVVLFEKSYDHIGGKMDTKEFSDVVWEKGPAIFSSGPAVDRYIAEFGLHLKELNGGSVGFFNPVTAVVEDVSEEYLRWLVGSWLSLIPTYEYFRNTYPPQLFQPGGYEFVDTYREEYPDLFLNAEEWVTDKNLAELSDLLYLSLTSEGFGLLSDLPAIYMLSHITPEHMRGMAHLVSRSERKGNVFMIKEGFREFVYNLVKDIQAVYMSYTLRSLNRSGFKESGKVWTLFGVGDGNEGSEGPDCNRVVLAFPPMLENLITVVQDLTPEEKYWLSKVQVHKYFSGGHILRKPKGGKLIYFGTRQNPAEISDGRPMLIIRSVRGKEDGAYMMYSWLYGQYDHGPAKKEEDYVDFLQKNFTITFNKAPPQLSFIKGHAFFPHVGVGAMADGFFREFAKMQGVGGVYYATTATAFESVNAAIENAELVAKQVLASL